MAKRATAKRLQAEFHAMHPKCWMCLFLIQSQTSKTELHHIAGRGKNHDVAENYAALCTRHHRVIQSLVDAELVCLVLKRSYDSWYYSPESICLLRGRAVTCWTELDVSRAERVMAMMRACS